LLGLEICTRCCWARVQDEERPLEARVSPKKTGLPGGSRIRLEGVLDARYEDEEIWAYKISLRPPRSRKYHFVGITYEGFLLPPWSCDLGVTLRWLHQLADDLEDGGI
jgi:hypothetical protein